MEMSLVRGKHKWNRGDYDCGSMVWMEIVVKVC